MLRNLNNKQLEAVQSVATSLQILAGPGSGKTRVLTTRVAWLVRECNVDPRLIMVVTFTNKAAREMKERLESDSLLGKQVCDHLVMGTFHSICARYLRCYGDRVGIQNNFIIADSNLSKHIMEKVHAENKDRLSMNGKNIRPAKFYAKISRAKCDGMDVTAYERANYGDFKCTDTILLFKEYAQHLQEENLVDFDDLLLLGRNLFRRHPHILQSMQHVLVDEFQDTNAVQYDLLKYITLNTKCLTIVGDPDQSIYGWRSADITNFNKMQSDYNRTEIVNLEENYRSTQSILKAAMRVVSQDTERIEKGLFTQNPEGVPMSWLKMQDEEDEAYAVAGEIRRLLKYSAGLIEYKDIAVLVRTNAMTRSFEQQCSSFQIPYRVVGGLRFLDRMEVKDIVSYLAFIYNPFNTHAFERIINVPKRGIGVVSLKRIQTVKSNDKVDIVHVLRDVASKNSIPGLPKKAQLGISDLIDLYDTIQRMIAEKKPISDMLNHIIDHVGYKEYLEKTSSEDWITRWDNVGELISLATSFEREESGSDVGAFLETCNLGDESAAESNKENSVTLCTMHAAKGLEWPCVFVAGCEEDLIPHSMSENINEERRLLYVGMTRAKCFLYCTHASLRQDWGRTRSTKATHFFDVLPDTDYQSKTPALNTKVRNWIAKILQRPEPSESDLDDEGETIFANNNFDMDNYDDVNDEAGWYYGNDDHKHYSKPPKWLKWARKSSTGSKVTAPRPTLSSSKPAFTPASTISVKRESDTTSSPQTKIAKYVPYQKYPSEEKTKPTAKTSAKMSARTSAKATTRTKTTCKPRSMVMYRLSTCINDALYEVGSTASKFTLDSLQAAVQRNAAPFLSSLNDNDIETETRKALDRLIDAGSLATIKSDGSESFAICL